MATKVKTYKLANILPMQRYMKIIIDDAVEMDEEGNFLINVGYLRVSTDKQADEGYGLDVQENSVVQHCKAYGFTNLVLFIDDGYTGTVMDRPALNGVIALIKDFNNHKTNIKVRSFIVPRIDRLGRTLLGTLQFIQDYIVSKKDCKNSTINQNKDSIEFASVAESYCRVEKNNPQGTFLLGLFATLAEYDRDQIVGKLKAGRIARVADGKWIGGGVVPYGYVYDKNKGELCVVPEQAEKIREIFRLYIEEKLSPQKIADRLGFKGDTVVTQIIKRKSLTGCIIFNGEEYRGNHEAIISLDRWNEAQDELEKRSVHRVASHYLLSGLLVCGECGAKMRYQKWGNHGEKKIVCYSTQKSKSYLVKDEDCQSERFWADDVENAVIQNLFSLSYLGDEKNKKSDIFIDPIKALEKQLKSIETKLAKAYSFDDDEEDEILRERILTLRKQKRDVLRQIQSEEEKSRIVKRVGKARDMLKNLQTIWPKITDEERQAICQDLIESVVIYKDARVDVHLKLENFLKKNQEA